jgi:hypothetical protein
MKMDIAEQESLAEREDLGLAVEIDDVKGDPAFQADGVTPITISVVGSLSKRYRRVVALARGRNQRRAIAKLTDKVVKAVVGDQDAVDEASGQELLDEQTEAVAACITGWSAGFTDKGADYSCTKANAIRLLKAYPHIQTKLEKEMENHARFFDASSTNSPT